MSLSKSSLPSKTENSKYCRNSNDNYSKTARTVLYYHRQETLLCIQTDIYLDTRHTMIALTELADS